MKKIELLKKQLVEDVKVLNRSLESLKYSLDKSKTIGLKDTYSMDELEVFESLSGRFSRSADILTQKILKTIFLLLQENAETFIDRCNLAEKMGIINESDELYNVRKLRNEIVHEYCMRDITEIFAPVLEFSEKLVAMIEAVEKYIDEKVLSKL